MENACVNQENFSKTRQAVHLLIQTNITHKRIIDQKTSSYEFHRSQHRMLGHISKYGSISSQKEIAKDIDISPAAVSVMLKKLECDGYVERTRGEDGDARQNSLKITEKGKKEMASIREIFDSVDNTMFKGFSDKEIDTFVEMLCKIKSNLNSIDNERTACTQEKTKGDTN